jgi:hypothetical protein
MALDTDTPPVETDDEFTKAFDQLSVATDAERAKTPDDARITPPPAGFDPPVTPTTPPVEGETPVEGGTPPEDQTKRPPQPTPPEDQTKRPPQPTPPPGPLLSDADLARIAAVTQQVVGPPQQRSQPQPQPQPQPEPSPFTPDEIAAVTEYQTEYPDIAKAEAVLRRADMLAAVRYVMAEVSKALQPTVATVQQLATRTHAGDLQRLVPDYNVTRDEIVAWAQQQPAYLHQGYAYVINRGTPEEVADLISRYRASTGAPVQQPPVQRQLPVQQQRQAPPTPQDPATRRALAGLSPVQTKRSASATGVEPVDFDSAFDYFANARR